ncbi:MAG: tRNA (guanosine(46)-N7)-methyltransferase TrmB [Melioribacteraceae bacterium]|nr:tRNA (guanosine(46)-N7)-methyltransferase TrmB [Melioribacteraceae bacterium]
MARRKHIKIRDVGKFENVFMGEDKDLEESILRFFGNNNPITLEIGCGRGDYSIALAGNFPERNFIGLDLRGDRIWNGSESATERNLKNVGFLVAFADQLPELFSKLKISEIWIPFPDPHLKPRDINRRLVAPKYLSIYREILNTGGVINLKTDERMLYNYALETLNEFNLDIIKHTDDLYSKSELLFEETIKTKYEMRYIAEGKKINLVGFKFK